MQNKTFLSALLLCLPFGIFGQDSFKITIDLAGIANDKVKVTVITPKITEATAEYVMASVIPGSYSYKDYGRFVEDFKAFDANGKKLKTKKTDKNVFLIKKADKLHKIEYLINDTWDVEKDEQYIFQPGGTNFEANSNFAINHYGLYGYIEGKKMLPYELTVKKPKGLYGATALDRQKETAEEDVFTAKNFVKMVDSPILYAVADTCSFISGGARIRFATYSKNGIIKSKEVMEFMKPMAQALENFFGTLPVDHYDFLMYFPEYLQADIAKFGGYGALEHSYCSFYFMPEFKDKQQVKEMMLGVTSHEFLHILTPLNIHSEQIEDFDFRNPKMSKHLWMYEGVTEYFSNLVQAQSKLIDEPAFMAEMRNKIRAAAKLKDVSFTQMSEGILTDEYKDMYMNVYNKGALFGLLLDIRLNELSGGKMNLKAVMMQLSKKYGPDAPFKDDALLDEIALMTYPEIGDFLKKHVEGAEPLPISSYLEKIGWAYSKEKNVQVLSFGTFGIDYNAGDKRFEVRNAVEGGNLFGLKNGDQFVSVNGEAVKMENAQKLLSSLFKVEKADEVTLTIIRDKAEMQIKAAPKMQQGREMDAIIAMPSPTPAQQELHKMLLGF